MPNKSWKRTQRVHAEIFGGRSSADRDFAPSTEDAPGAAKGLLTIESKHNYGGHPKYLKAWFDEVEGYVRRKGGGSIPVVIWHEKGKRVENDLVFMRLKHFRLLVDLALKEALHDDAERARVVARIVEATEQT